MRRPMRPCRQPGCPELVQPPQKYCPTHTWTDEQRQEYKRRLNRDYDRIRRDQRARRFYKSREWEQVRQAVLVATKYAGIIARYAPRFGLDPSGRASLAIPRGEEKQVDPFEAKFGVGRSG